MNFKKLIFFLFLNFTALLLGSLFTSEGVIGDWYMNLNKAPWTPSGWVFGAMWTIIMICLAFFMSHYTEKESNWRKLMILYAVQLLLNIMWNPVYFNLHYQLVGLLILVMLFCVVFTMYNFSNGVKFKNIRFLLIPYLVWLIIAFSLNAYTAFNN